ncbi:MAG: hypothetical protein ACP5JC_03010, partial [Candidatus Micrarchaeia archaeon]
MASKLEDEVYIHACGLPFEEYKEKIMEVVKKRKGSELIVAKVLTHPDIMGKSYNLEVLKEIFTKLVEINEDVLKKLEKGLRFCEEDEKLDVVRRQNAKAILVHITNGERKVRMVIRIACRKMFRNTGEEPFEIAEEVVGRNPKLFYELSYYLLKRLGEEKNPIEERILRKRMLKSILNIFERVSKDGGVVRCIVNPLIFHVLEDGLFEDALVEIGKNSTVARKMMNRWKDEDGVSRRKVLNGVWQKIMD